MKPKFNVGDSVMVHPTSDDVFSEEFQGTIVKIDGGLFDVEDQESNVFQVGDDQMELILNDCPECKIPLQTDEVGDKHCLQCGKGWE